MLAWVQSIGKEHGIIFVTIRFDNANEIRWKKDKFSMGCERWGNCKRRILFYGSYSLKVKCSFMLRYVPSGSSLKVMVRCVSQS